MNAARKPQVSAWSRKPKSHASIACYSGREALMPFVSRSDVLVCLLPLTPDTEGASFLRGAVDEICCRRGFPPGSRRLVTVLLLRQQSVLLFMKFAAYGLIDFKPCKNYMLSVASGPAGYRKPVNQSWSVPLRCAPQAS